MSCETQLIEATYDWTNILNKGKGQIDVILLDFCKAFDVVPHHRLLMKLYMYGITGKTYRWIEDFLGNRTQEVVVNGSKSECGMVKSGVPHSTVLGPLLFLIYINDIESQMWTIGVGLRMSTLDSNVAGSIPASICFLLEQETLSALLQSTQL